jgi:outer membrane protein
MKRIVAACVGIYLMSLLPAPAMAEVKIGYIDTVKIFANFKDTVEAEELYKKEVDGWKKQAEEMEAELSRMSEEIQSQTLMLSADKLAEKKLLFDQKRQEYQKYMNETFGDDGLAARRNKELTEPIVEKINAVIAKVAEEMGYTLVLDSSQGTLVYAAPDMDLTDIVIERLEQEMPANQ